MMLMARLLIAFRYDNMYDINQKMGTIINEMKKHQQETEVLNSVSSVELISKRNDRVLPMEQPARLKHRINQNAQSRNVCNHFNTYLGA